MRLPRFDSCCRRPARQGLRVVLAGVLGAALPGCALWPWATKDRTTIITPAMRVASIREMAPVARDATDADQAAMCEQLAQQIRTEPDPIVRRAIQETISECKTPLAATVLVAGLQDDDPEVRIACCRMLGRRADPATVGPLSRVVGADAEADVRMAAVDALGQIKSPDSVRGIAAALQDRDPALQFAGVEAMKRVSDADLGNDVQAWRQYAAQQNGAAQDVESIAAQPSAAATK